MIRVVDSISERISEGCPRRVQNFGERPVCLLHSGRFAMVGASAVFLLSLWIATSRKKFKKVCAFLAEMLF